MTLYALVYNEGDIENTRKVIACHYQLEKLKDLALMLEKDVRYDRLGLEIFETTLNVKNFIFGYKGSIKEIFKLL